MWERGELITQVTGESGQGPGHVSRVWLSRGTLMRTSLVVQWLGLRDSTAGATGSIPGRRPCVQGQLEDPRMPLSREVPDHCTSRQEEDWTSSAKTARGGQRLPPTYALVPVIEAALAFCLPISSAQPLASVCMLETTMN